MNKQNTCITYFVPLEIIELVVMSVRVIVSVPCMAIFVSHQHHRGALTHKSDENSEEMAGTGSVQTTKDNRERESNILFVISWQKINIETHEHMENRMTTQSTCETKRAKWKFFI